MDDNYTRPITRDDLLFTVEMALRKASRLWPRKRAPGDHDRLRPVAEEVVAYFELCGLRVFERPKARGHGTPDPHGAVAQSGGETGEPAAVREDPCP